METKTVNGINGGEHASGTPLTTSVTDQAAPGLLTSSIDQRIVRVRPSATPVDQLTRCIGSRGCGSMTVDYYTVDTRVNECKCETVPSVNDIEEDDSGLTLLTVTVDRANVFAPSDTILFPEVLAGSARQPLVGYVRSAAGKELRVVCLNASSDGKEAPRLQPAPKVTEAWAVRMGRAASELDVQTGQFEALPMKRSNNCQIFKMQVEQSLLQRLSDKEVDWNFSDQEEAAVMDMRLGMEKSFLFGARAKFIHPDKNEYVYMTGGIWNQAASEATLPASPKEADVIKLCAQVFTNNNGSKKKILLGGTKLITALNNIQFYRSISGEGSLTRWGIRFREIVSNFGTLYVIHSEVFDQCHHSKDGMVIDPDFITKYTHIPFSKERLDLRKAGNRNTDAIVLTEASCVVLRHPTTHFRIIGE